MFADRTPKSPATPTNKALVGKAAMLTEPFSAQAPKTHGVRRLQHIRYQMLCPTLCHLMLCADDVIAGMMHRALKVQVKTFIQAGRLDDVRMLAGIKSKVLNHAALLSAPCQFIAGNSVSRLSALAKRQPNMERFRQALRAGE